MSKQPGITIIVETQTIHPETRRRVVAISLIIAGTRQAPAGGFVVTDEEYRTLLRGPFTVQAKGWTEPGEYDGVKVSYRRG